MSTRTGSWQAPKEIDKDAAEELKSAVEYDIKDLNERSSGQARQILQLQGTVTKNYPPPHAPNGLYIVQLEEEEFPRLVQVINGMRFVYQASLMEV